MLLTWKRFFCHAIPQGWGAVYVEKIFRALNPGGQAVFIEFEKMECHHGDLPRCLSLVCNLLTSIYSSLIEVARYSVAKELECQSVDKLVKSHGLCQSTNLTI